MRAAMAKKTKSLPSPHGQKIAFQCKNCGAVEPAEAAGENDVPLACHICRAGVHFNPDGTKVYVPENWIKLADLSDAQLAKGHHVHGLKRAHVAKHKGIAKVHTHGIVKDGEVIKGKDVNVTANSASR